MPTESCTGHLFFLSSAVVVKTVSQPLWIILRSIINSKNTGLLAAWRKWLNWCVVGITLDLTLMDTYGHLCQEFLTLGDNPNYIWSCQCLYYVHLQGKHRRVHGFGNQVARDAWWGETFSFIVSKNLWSFVSDKDDIFRILQSSFCLVCDINNTIIWENTCLNLIWMWTKYMDMKAVLRLLLKIIKVLSVLTFQSGDCYRYKPTEDCSLQRTILSPSQLCRLPMGVLAGAAASSR